MAAGRFIGRVGGLAVALGVGAAAATGLGPGVAAAAPDGSESSASSDSKSDTKSDPGTTTSKDRETTARETADQSSDTKSEAEPKRRGTVAPQATDRVRSTLDRLSQRDRPGSALRRAVRDALDDIADRPVRPLPAAKAERPDPEAGIVVDPVIEADADANIGTEPDQSRPATKRPNHSAPRAQPEQRLTAPSTATIAEPTATDDPDLVERLDTPRNVVAELRSAAAELSAAVVPESLRAPATLIPIATAPAVPEAEPVPTPPRVLASAVSTLLGGLSNPLGADNSPLAPAASPALWAALAAARREIGLVEPTQILSAAAEVQQTVAPLAVASVADQPIGLAPGIVVSPELLEHVTRTAPAGLLDQLTNAALGVMRQISDVIGVNIAFEISRLMSSDSPPWFTTLGLSVTQDTYGPDDEQQVWVIAPKNPSGEYVVALHGGGFEIRPNVLQWLDYASMARETGATVIVPMYPLAHEGGDAATVIPPMADYITELSNEDGADNVSVYGDSAGALIGMLAAQEILRRCNEQGAGRQTCLDDDMPDRMVLISPALGGHTLFTDPNVDLVDDPVFSAAIIHDPDSVDWQGDLPIDSPLWNPMYGPTEGLPTTVIYVGTRDIATPGTLLFAERMLDEDTDGDPNLRIVMGMGHIHDWALGGPASNTEAPKWRGAIYRELGLADQQEL